MRLWFFYSRVFFREWNDCEKWLKKHPRANYKQCPNIAAIDAAWLNLMGKPMDANHPCTPFNFLWPDADFENWTYANQSGVNMVCITKPGKACLFVEGNFDPCYNREVFCVDCRCCTGWSYENIAVPVRLNDDMTCELFVGQPLGGAVR
jgi:hypothetical protein